MNVWELEGGAWLGQRVRGRVTRHECGTPLTRPGSLRPTQILVREAHSGAASMALQAAALQLLTSLLAFNLEVHSTVMHTKLVKRLVQLCRCGCEQVGGRGRGWLRPESGGHWRSRGTPRDGLGSALQCSGPACYLASTPFAIARMPDGPHSCQAWRS